MQFNYSFETLFSTYIKLARNVRYVEYDILYNVLLFVPLGIMLGDYRLRRAALAVLATTVTIELLQIIFSVGLFELCDILDNFIGGMCGYWIARLKKHLLSNGRKCSEGVGKTF